LQSSPLSNTSYFSAGYIKDQTLTCNDMSKSHPTIDQQDSSGLNLAELNFCYQYCTFVKSQPEHHPHEGTVHKFLGRYPLPTDTVYPITWTTDPTECTQVADRFVELPRSLLLTEERTSTSSVFSMATSKNIAWYFANGFAGNQLLNALGVNAVLTALAANDVNSSNEHDFLPQGCLPR
jgi:hypothetical protein